MGHSFGSTRYGFFGLMATTQALSNMRICSYCGKEYSDDVALCAVDGTSLQEEEPAPPVISPPPPLPQISLPSTAAAVAPNERWLRIFELILICTVAVGGSLLASGYSLFGLPVDRPSGSLQWSYAILNQCAALALLWYILFRGGKSFSEIGLRLKIGDIGWSLVLYFAGAVVYAYVHTALYYCGLTAVNTEAAGGKVADYLFGGGIFVATLILQVINPFFEELIVRAYLITEVRQLTNSAVIAVCCSTALQISYHLYQGIPLAISEGAMFFIWSLYYAKTNRIMPVILAHMYADVSGTLWYLYRHH